MLVVPYNIKKVPTILKQNSVRLEHKFTNQNSRPNGKISCDLVEIGPGWTTVACPISFSVKVL